MTGIFFFKKGYDAEDKVCEEQLACIVSELDEGNWCAFMWLLIRSNLSAGNWSELHVGCVFAWHLLVIFLNGCFGDV